MSTSRLKRKAYDDDSGLLADNKLNESFVTCGTALPSLADTRQDQGEYVPVWKQEVRDEKGRRRLHGAFTGGFSAGYFNTVGSKEGWTPSTFVSKKDRERQLQQQQGNSTSSSRPEDFMDEEDLAELKASRGFKTADIFSGSSTLPSTSTGTEQDGSYSSAVANSLADLVQPGSSRIGEKIMIKMGWRPGQGVGPRVSYARHREQVKTKYTAAKEEEESEEARKHTYAPVDQPLFLFDNKENQYGLGYIAGQTLMNQLEGSAGGKGKARESSQQQEHEQHMAEGKRMPRGGAFGISALEDADEDDYDIYASSTKNQRNMILADEDDDDDMDGYSAKRPELLRWQDSNNARKKQAQQDRSKVPLASRDIQKFADGTPMIAGFVLAKKSQPPDQRFPAPVLPKNWEPNPQAIWDQARAVQLAASTSTQPPSSTNKTAVPGQKGQQNMLSADDRAKMLGEPVQPKSVFEFMSKKNKERLDRFIESGTKTSTTLPNQADSLKQEQVQEEELLVPTIESRVAQAALKGFMPYGDDPSKQRRYRSFLEYYAVPSSSSSSSYTPTPPNKNSTRAEINKELMDFSAAAAIFKPMSGLMANRFTSGTSNVTIQDSAAPLPGLRVPVVPTVESGETAKSYKEIKSQEEKKKRELLEQEELLNNPIKAAAKMKSFGPLTRTEEFFYPSRLLCKRFNVPDPHPDGPPSNSNNDGSSVLAQDKMDEMMNQRAGMNGFGNTGVSFEHVPMNNDKVDDEEKDKANTPTTGGETATKELPIPSVTNVGLGEDETQGRDTLTYTKPSMDIFKAIFADSDDDEDDDKDDEIGKEVTDNPVELDDKMELYDPSARPNLTSFEPIKKDTPSSSSVSVPLTSDSLASFKPTFKTRSKDKVKDKDEKKQNKNNKKSKAAIMSFDVDDDDGEQDAANSVKEKKNKKRKSEDKDKDKEERKSKKEKVKPVIVEVEEQEEDEWVEKAAPASAPPAIPTATITSARKGTRMRAEELF